MKHSVTFLSSENKGIVNNWSLIIQIQGSDEVFRLMNYLLWLFKLLESISEKCLVNQQRKNLFIEAAWNNDMKRFDDSFIAKTERRTTMDVSQHFLRNTRLSICLMLQDANVISIWFSVNSGWNPTGTLLHRKNREIPWKRREIFRAIVVMNLLLDSMAHGTLKIYHQKHKIAAKRSIRQCWRCMNVGVSHNLSGECIFSQSRMRNKRKTETSLFKPIWSLSFNSISWKWSVIEDSMSSANELRIQTKTRRRAVKLTNKRWIIEGKHKIVWSKYWKRLTIQVAKTNNIPRLNLRAVGWIPKMSRVSLAQQAARFKFKLRPMGN